ncbi:thiopeptide-type bacteriocin biosynthesis domain protein [compost metagenome]
MQELFHSHFNEELTTGSIHELQIAHYQPEYNRYPDMLEAETLFMQDSELVLERLESDAEEYRLETSLGHIAVYLSGLTLPERVSFCQTHRDAFLQEFGTALKPKLNALYRQHFIWVKNTLDATPPLTFLPPKPESLASYIHMHVNRNFISEARKYEMLLYHFLYRHYDSILARENLDLKKKR